MEIIKKKKLKRLKACRSACQRIYEIITESPEDEHGNIKAFPHDKQKDQILTVLRAAGFGVGHKKIVGIDDFDYEVPWPVRKRGEV